MRKCCSKMDVRLLGCRHDDALSARTLALHLILYYISKYHLNKKNQIVDCVEIVSRLWVFIIE